MSALSYIQVNGHEEILLSRTPHDELVVLVIDLLLQRSLGTTSVAMKTDAGESTNLVIHHSVANIVS